MVPGRAGVPPALPGVSPGRSKRTDHFASTDPEFVEGAAGPELAERKEGGIEFTPGLNHRFSQPLLEKCFTFIFRKISFAWSRYAICRGFMQDRAECLGQRRIAPS
jgi:hypothetical protein